MNFLTDLIAYPIIGILSMLSHFAIFGPSDVSNEALDQADRMTSGKWVAEWRYKVNHALGGTRTYEEYAAQENQELIGCSCGCGCGCLTMIIIGLIFLLVIATL